MKNVMFEAIDKHAERFIGISKFIAAHPELGHQEFLASSKLIEELEYHGFQVERNVLGLETAFIGTYDTGKPGPTVAFLCEYDALPELGHACGHHLICTMSLSAAVGLKAVIDEQGGVIRVYGTPAEETKGAKVPMAAEGMFDDVDFALMAHPYFAYEESGTSLAMDALQFEYFGKASHAAATPYRGVNALDAVLQLFNGINALRQQLRSDARVHGIIADGGKAPNIIPDYACAQFYVRAATRAYTNEVVEKVRAVAEGAAMQTGCRLTVSNYEYSYDELRTNRTLSELFNDNLIAMGVERSEIQTGKDNGSLDLGNVSIHCPTIHPYMKVVDEHHDLHTVEFRDLAMNDKAFEAMIFSGKVLAATAYDVFSNAELLAKIKEEFQAAERQK